MKKSTIRKLENPFEQKFIIPAKAWATVNYEKQTDEPQRVDTINIKANTKATIIFRTNSLLHLKVRDSQFQFGGEKGKKPTILKYKNPYFKKHIQWYLDEAYDWHGIYHLIGSRRMYKDITYVDGFEIQTHKKGTYPFNMEFTVSKKGVVRNVRTSLTINVI
jgi:hypothetical protein